MDPFFLQTGVVEGISSSHLLLQTSLVSRRVGGASAPPNRFQEQATVSEILQPYLYHGLAPPSSLWLRRGAALISLFVSWKVSPIWDHLNLSPSVCAVAALTDTKTLQGIDALTLGWRGAAGRTRWRTHPSAGWAIWAFSQQVMGQRRPSSSSSLSARLVLCWCGQVQQEDTRRRGGPGESQAIGWPRGLHTPLMLCMTDHWICNRLQVKMEELGSRGSPGARQEAALAPRLPAHGPASHMVWF